MKPATPLLVVALLQISRPIFVRSTALFSPAVHPSTVSSSQGECLLFSDPPSQNLTETLVNIQAGLPPPQLEDNCDTTEKLFKEYPNVELAYFNASLLFPPTVLPMEVLENCTGDGPQIDDNFTAILKETIGRLAFGGASCPDIVSKYPSARSGFYVIQDGNGEDVTVYCDMDGANCDGHPGWMRIGYVSMTTPDAKCPPGLNTIKPASRKYCGRFESGSGCVSTLFDSLGHNYTRVCGRMKALQHGATDAFYSSALQSQGLDGWYVDGISITNRSPRNHIWTYAAGMSEVETELSSCPCNKGFSNSSLPPQFVQEDYYCESGNPQPSPAADKLYSQDYLWDGSACNSLETSCCIGPKTPWFSRHIGQSTQDDVEVRVCTRGEGTLGVFLEDLEILVR